MLKVKVLVAVYRKNFFIAQCLSIPSSLVRVDLYRLRCLVTLVLGNSHVCLECC